MKNSYCWGNHYTPARILDESDDALIVEIEGASRTIPISKIVGRVSDGDRIQVLVSGGAWLWGRAQVDEGGLWVVLDSGRRWILSNARLIKVIPEQLSLFDTPIIGATTPIISSDHKLEPVLLPILEDYESDEMAVAQQYDLLKPINVGDRIRIVLAGPPLAHLTGAMATIDGLPTCGLVPVIVDGYGLKLFRREQLDAEPDEEAGTGETPQLPEDEPPTEFYPGQQVTHRGRWLGKSGLSRPLVPI